MTPPVSAGLIARRNLAPRHDGSSSRGALAGRSQGSARRMLQPSDAAISVERVEKKITRMAQSSKSSADATPVTEPIIIETGGPIVFRVPSPSPVMTPALARLLLKVVRPVGPDRDDQEEAEEDAA